jgi:hypothetical protein
MTRHSAAELREKLSAALTEVSAAEGSLEELLRNLRAAPRAEKVTVTTAIEAAFARLRSARETLKKLDGVAAEDGGH